MASTYKATLKGNCLEWAGDGPERIPPEKPVAVLVTILDEGAAAREGVSQGQRMAAALEQLAAMHALPDIGNPVAWEREMRQDRELPRQDP